MHERPRDSTAHSSVQCLSPIRSNCDSSIGSRLNMFLKPLLKRWPNGLLSVLDFLEWFSLSGHVLRVRLREGVRSRLDIVPGKAGGAEAGGAGAATGGEAVQVLELSDVVEDLDIVKLCGGLGGAFTNDGSAGAVIGAVGIRTDSYGICCVGGSPALSGCCALIQSRLSFAGEMGEGP